MPGGCREVAYILFNREGDRKNDSPWGGWGFKASAWFFLAAVIIPLHLFDEETDLTAEVSSISPRKNMALIKTIENFEGINMGFIRNFMLPMAINLLLFSSKVDKKRLNKLFEKEVYLKIIMGLIKIVKSYEGEMIKT